MLSAKDADKIIFAHHQDISKGLDALVTAIQQDKSLTLFSGIVTNVSTETLMVPFSKDSFAAFSTESCYQFHPVHRYQINILKGTSKRSRFDDLVLPPDLTVIVPVCSLNAVANLNDAVSFCSIEFNDGLILASNVSVLSPCLECCYVKRRSDDLHSKHLSTLRRLVLVACSGDAIAAEYLLLHLVTRASSQSSTELSIASLPLLIHTESNLNATTITQDNDTHLFFYQRISQVINRLLPFNEDVTPSDLTLLESTWNPETDTFSKSFFKRPLGSHVILHQKDQQLEQRICSELQHRLVTGRAAYKMGEESFELPFEIGLLILASEEPLPFLKQLVSRVIPLKPTEPVVSLEDGHVNETELIRYLLEARLRFMEQPAKDLFASDVFSDMAQNLVSFQQEIPTLVRPTSLLLYNTHNTLLTLTRALAALEWTVSSNTVTREHWERIKTLERSLHTRC